MVKVYPAALVSNDSVPKPSWPTVMAPSTDESTVILPVVIASALPVVPLVLARRVNAPKAGPLPDPKVMLFAAWVAFAPSTTVVAPLDRSITTSSTAVARELSCQLLLVPQTAVGLLAPDAKVSAALPVTGNKADNTKAR